MLLDQIPLRFKNLSLRCEINYSLAGPASDTAIEETEQRLSVSFPQPVRSFYQHYNGLRVDDPELEILPLEQMLFSSSNLLRFARVNGDPYLHFDTSAMNNAGQWNIVTTGGFCVTLSMASFWSNRMWTWIEKRRAIWQEERNITSCCT